MSTVRPLQYMCGLSAFSTCVPGNRALLAQQIVYPKQNMRIHILWQSETPILDPAGTRAQIILAAGVAPLSSMPTCTTG